MNLPDPHVSFDDFVKNFSFLKGRLFTAPFVQSGVQK
jgi:hypothetical protein